MANETGVERELALLGELDGIAYDYDRYDYGLPIDVDGPAEEMIAKVLAYKDSCTQELRAKIALYEAKDRCQPPGFEIGDDCSAELAVKLEKAEAEVRELKVKLEKHMELGFGAKVTDREQRARTALIRTDPCTHDTVGEEDICDGCKYEWEKSLVQRVVNFSAEEVKLALREVVKGLRKRGWDEIADWLAELYQL